MAVEYRVSSELPFEGACSRVPEAASRNGFAVLAEVRTSDILRSKGFGYADLRTYDICNAGYASRALALGSGVETMIPCRLVVKRVGDRSEVSVQLPRELFRLAGARAIDAGGEVEGFLAEVEAGLRRVAEDVAGLLHPSQSQ